MSQEVGKDVRSSLCIIPQLARKQSHHLSDEVCPEPAESGAEASVA